MRNANSREEESRVREESLGGMDGGVGRGFVLDVPYSSTRCRSCSAATLTPSPHTKSHHPLLTLSSLRSSSLLSSLSSPRYLQGQQQIANSLSHLDKKKSSGITSVTDIRVAADFRENQRRINEELLRQDRLQRLQEEAVRSGKQNAAVEMKWAELLDQNMPQELHKEILHQKSACADIISSKDGLIREFQQQLKSKDEEYVKALKQQADDIEEMLTRMRLEFKELQEEYEVEVSLHHCRHRMRSGSAVVPSCTSSV